MIRHPGQEPLLSVVVVSRNDDHGGNMLNRMQLFVTGWLEQAKRHNLASELIIVEWNPPPDRPPLAQVLRWPEQAGPCAIRIIQVPPGLHQRLRGADKLPLFQMIGKNVGIRRARGRFILATNIDILFSDELMRYFASGRLSAGDMYRIDRHDVPPDVPTASIDEQLEYCRQNVIRINSRNRTLVMGEESTANKQSSVIEAFSRRLRNIRHASDTLKLGNDTCAYIYNTVLSPIIYGNLHTNACGDFTLMAREHWFALRGNVEFEMYSLHLDGLMCAVAHYGGAKEIVLTDPMRIYHIEHALGSGWVPGLGAKLLDERLKKEGISQLTYEDYLKYLRRIRWHRGPTVFNNENWGLGKETLKEYAIIKVDWDKD